MGYNKNDPYNDMAGCIGMILFALIAAPIALLVHSGKKPPVTKLRELNRPAVWGNQIQSVQCAQCHAINEQYQTFCANCSAPIGQMLSSRNPKQPLSIEEAIAFATLIFMVILLFALFLRLIS